MQPLHYKVWLLAIAGLLLVAVANLDYFFYNFLRATVSLGGCLLVFRAIRTRQIFWIGLGLPAIVLFNRWFGFEFPKSTWIPIDLLFSLGFFIAGLSLGRPFMVRKIDDKESHELERNDADLGGAIAILLLVLFILFGLWGLPPSPNSCENYVQDPRGGYCEG